MTTLINLALYQIGWFCCVLGAAHGYAVTGAFCALALCGLHLLLVKNRGTELRLMIQACLLGAIIDSTQQAVGILTFTVDSAWPFWLPLWVFVIWAQFATLFRFALSWLQGRYLLASLFGFVGGPLAYYAGVRLGAANFSDPIWLSLACLGVVWAAVTPFLLWLARTGQPGTYRSFN
ncbi:MAG: DUF2878 domain-containing protein [Desulfuromonas sp.]|nr:MAG: DUF2878 domain-containing protein [Desulfuromonas sp.]